MTKIKICGITNIEDALACAELNVDFIGLIFAESPRQIDASQAAEILKAVEGRVKTVGVFKDQPAADIFRIALNSGIEMIQLHGSETPEFAGALPFPVIKAVELKPDTTAYECGMFYSSLLLIDKPKDPANAGVPPSFWLEHATERIQEMRNDLPEFIMAGGLTPENVADVVRKLKPIGVDVSSGVETSPGKKDKQKLEAFCASVRAEVSNCGGRGTPRRDD